MLWFGAVFLAGAGFWVLRRRHKFPGKWVHTFGLRYEGAREALDGPRREVRAWARRADQEESLARKTLAKAEADREQRLHALDRRRDRLRAPGPGEQIGALGPLALFRHSLKVTAGSGTYSVPLAGMKVEFAAGDTYHYLYCTDAGEHPHQAKYPRVPSDPEIPEQRFDEDTVRDFMVTTQRAVAQENAFRARLPQLLKKVEAEREQAENDTGAIETAQQHLEEIQDRNRDDPHSLVLEEKLTKACKDWENLTGCTPPR
ncbi:hypothetical protein [Streptomyces sp. NPDC058330]|uniref:hypothetical protein n=1 Tax=Streptomyces sp. NPDC058330 TaxID=3346449 RepID=UPI0036F0FB49